MNIISKELDDDLLILSSSYQAKEQGKYFGGDMKYLNKLFVEKEAKVQAAHEKAAQAQSEADQHKPL